MSAVQSSLATQISAAETRGGHCSITDELHLFRVPKHRFRHGQSYGIVHAGKLILIDAVHRVTRPAVEDLLAEYPVSALLLTGAGLLGRAFAPPEDLSEWLDDAPVLIHSMDAGTVPGLYPLESNRPLLNDLGIAFYPIPGPTPGSTAYLHRPTGCLFTGDLIVGNNYDYAEQRFTHPPIPEENWAAYVRGWEAIPANGIRAVFPLHGQPCVERTAFADARGAALDRDRLVRP